MRELQSTGRSPTFVHRFQLFLFPAVLLLLLEALLHDGRDAPAAFRALVWSKVRLNVGSFAVSALAIAALAPWVLRIYGPTFAAARDPLILLGL